MLFLNICYGQTVKESDYVYEGKTIQYTIPRGFKHAEYEDEPFVNIYLLDTTGFQEASDDYFETVPFDKGIAVGYIENEDEYASLELIVENLKNIIVTEYDEFIIFRQDPEYFERNGLPYATTKCKYPDFEFDFNEFKVCIIEFGEFYVFFATFHMKQSDDKLMDYLFDEITSSIDVTPTTKENTMLTWEILERSYKNNGVDTHIDTDKIHFEKESSSYWESWSDESFLLRYDYGAQDAQIQGSVRVLSAGIESSEMTDEELTDFLSENELNYPIEKVTLIGDVKGVSKEFKKYSITGSEDILQLYTTQLDGELLLIFAIRAAYTSSAFKKYYERFVTSMYISD